MFLEAYLAGVSFLVGVVVELEDVVVEEGLGVLEGLFAAFGTVEELADVVFDSPQLEDHSRHELVPLARHPILAHDEVRLLFLLAEAVDGLVGLLLFGVGGLGLVLVGGDVEHVDLGPLRAQALHLEVPDEVELLNLH